MTNERPSIWSPFRHRTYAIIWAATLVSNIGGWMYSSTSAWLMTSLDPAPSMVSLVQVAASLPMFLFAIPAGALADIVDRRRFLIATPNSIVAAGSLVTAFAMVLFGIARSPLTALLACFMAGSSWIAVLANLNISAQLALPEWVKGRGLAIYVTLFFGAMTLGSLLWGQVAAVGGLPLAHFIAAGGAAVAVVATWHWRLQTEAGPDLTPSMAWPTPVVNEKIDGDSGPVLVMVDYRINPKDRDAFLAAVSSLSHERGRDGAFAWGVFADVALPGRIVGTFYVESWFEHLRQHERVTKADHVIEANIQAFLTEPSRTTHLLAATATTNGRSARVD